MGLCALCQPTRQFAPIDRFVESKHTLDVLGNKHSFSAVTDIAVAAACGGSIRILQWLKDTGVPLNRRYYFVHHSQQHKVKLPP